MVQRIGQHAELIVQVLLLDVRENQYVPAPLLAVRRSPLANWVGLLINIECRWRRSVKERIRIVSEGVVILDDRQSEIVQIVAALQLTGSLTSRIDGRQQQRHEHADD